MSFSLISTSILYWRWDQYELHDVDDKSRALIEQMLAEEQYYYGDDTISTLPTSQSNQRKKKGDLKGKKIAKKQKSDMDFQLTDDSSLSSISLPSHKTRWTSEEDDSLNEALTKYGYGNWRVISEFVKTRNPLQCKNHARHWLLSDKLDKSHMPNKESEDMKKKDMENKQAPKNIESSMDMDEDISVEDEFKTNAENELQKDLDENDILIEEPKDEQMADKDTPLDKTKAQDIEIDTPVTDDISKTQQIQPLIPADTNSLDNPTADIKFQKPSKSPEDIHDKDSASPEPSLKENRTESPKSIPKDTLPKKSISTDNTENAKNTDKVDKADNANNTDSRFDRHYISEEEKTNNPEWFNNKQSKTPDRYLRIRNHMLDCWKSCKPRYLTKTSARKGLQNCGDVNAIGRVHSYLESVGAINVDCITNAPRPPKRVARETFEDDETFFNAAELVVGYEGPRKRKVRNYIGEWVDPKELEGRVIEHGHDRQTARPKRVIKRPQQYYGGDDFGRGYDPFRLVPVDYYGDDDPAPFTVEIDSDVLLIMDFHSHLAHTEIIGLLGGNFVNNNGAKILKVESVFPCRSTSTGIQCEMDPASEMMAREAFSEKGYTVVGWYHSHPTFEPHPSIRDIENQTSYQTLFRDEKTGDEPFIGVIVTPYDPENVSDHSQVQYLHISNRWNETRSFRLPFACRRMVQQSEQVSPEVMANFERLVDEFKDYEHKIDMSLPFGHQTRLDKLLDSLRANMFLNAEQETEFLEKVRNLMVNTFNQKKPALETAKLDVPTKEVTEPVSQPVETLDRQ
ncbi:hypothetical protein J3Q64DRAFT_1635044 [Phycomyces blakesleeanus]|uniref:Myb-like, SWIRM and MPN domain-containing protein 1 n=1 Tax=Phycomyces blakesleeanus TaxID=4837 RepID=A0ABR3B6Z7_PHYBL